MAQFDSDVVARARISEGRSDNPIYRMVANVLAEREVRDATLIDVGCGRGELWKYVKPAVRRYVGVDAVRYDGFPEGLEFRQANLDDDAATAEYSGVADVVAAVETIEHLENPRAFLRLLVGVARVGGLVLVTTPNQLSALSLLTLGIKGRHGQFQDSHYPAHLTALLPEDLRRIAAEVRLSDVQIVYSSSGRIPLTARRYPAVISRNFASLCSDNVLVVGRRTL